MQRDTQTHLILSSNHNETEGGHSALLDHVSTLDTLEIQRMEQALIFNIEKSKVLFVKITRKLKLAILLTDRGKQK